MQRVRELLEAHAEVRAAVNAPISHFKSRPLAAAKKNLPLVDLLLAHGADLNLKSEWWAGGFGLLEYDCTPDAARDLGYHDIADLLLRRASPAQRLLAACATADRAAAEAVIASQPGVVSTLTADQIRLIADRAHANDTAAVTLMLDVGFDPLARGVDDWEPIRWAAFHGNADLVRRLLQHTPPIGVPDPTYGGTPLGQCLYGSLHGWECCHGDFATTVRLLLDAGERFDPAYLPIGRDDVDAVLRAHFAADPRSAHRDRE